MAKKKVTRMAASKQPKKGEEPYDVSNHPLTKIGHCLQSVAHILDHMEAQHSSEPWPWAIVKQVNPGLATVIGICCDEVAEYRDAERLRGRS